MVITASGTPSNMALVEVELGMQDVVLMNVKTYTSLHLWY